MKNLPNSILSLCVLALFGLALVPKTVSAQTDIYVKGSGRLLPIAVPQLCLAQGEGNAAKEIPQVIAKDLRLSGVFEVLSENTYIETAGKCIEPEQTAFSDWTVIGAEGLVKGTVEETSTGVRVKLFLLDVQRQKIVLGKEYNGTASQVRAMGHRFANEILKHFTGEYGPFGSQISFSSKVGRFKELFVMDMDGSNIRQLTNDRSLSVSSSWHPSGESLVYTSYRFRAPDLFSVNVLNRSVLQLTSGPALEVSAKYTRDGSAILASLTAGSDSSLVLLNPAGKLISRVTPSSRVIDVSPSWSPDNSQITFCSNRSGGPQIYTMNADGSGVKRISFVTSTYCTSPTWSPKGDKIAFVCRADRGFQIFVTNADGTAPLQLTSMGDNEDPSWSPDGNYLAFATTFGKGSVTSIAMMRDDGSNIQQLTSGRIGDSAPSWGPLPE